MSLRAQKKALSRQSILSATHQLLGERGFEATTMRDIAVAANISYQTLYNYFPTKGLIIQALLAQTSEFTMGQVQERMQRYSGGLLTTLHACIRIALKTAEDHDKALWRIVTSDVFRQQTTDTAFTVDMAEVGQAISLQVLDSLLAKAQARGELSDQLDRQVMARVLVAISEYAFMDYILKQQAPLADTLRQVRAQMTLVLTPYLLTS